MEPIAIIGIGCRFPGANNPESFWHLLHNGGDAICEVPSDRWDIDEYYDPEPGVPGKMSTRWGGFLDQVDQFDPAFFGISPREAERMDPQQRLVLEVAWEALEQAGIAADSLSGTQAGVFMGIGNYDYCRLLTQNLEQVNAYDGTGNTLSIAANRLSYILNLRGPSAVIETACSSSLVALHFACRSLQSGETDLCLVGGASLMLSPEPFITYSHARMMAADGRCKTFDASADGYVRGEGGGIVVLKRLSDARRDRNNVIAVIRGSAVNQDGQSNGLTAPNGPSQQAVIRQALQNAGVSAAEISYVEAHGTGTSLGDPIEFKSLKAVLMAERSPDRPCWLGSVKTNIGHLEAASGIASVIKVALALQHGEIPPHLHFKQLNPYISLDGTSFCIPTAPQPWNVASGQRFAGVSAFGFGGTNCHVVLEAAIAELKSAYPLESGVMATSSPHSLLTLANGHAPKEPVMEGERPLHVLTLSAKTEQALKDLAQRYRDFLANHPNVSLADLCYTANTGRSHFEYRLAIVTASNQQLSDQLQAFVANRVINGLRTGQAPNGKRPRIAFLFTGQGAQYVKMGHQLYSTEPVFRDALDRCDAILRPYLKQSLLSILYPDQAHSNLTDCINETAYTQPALFALEYALVQLWKSWGVEPTAVMGHSVGEYAAACVAGVFSLEDGLKLMVERARLMQALPPNGEMVAVFANEATVKAAIQPYQNEVAIAAINGPGNTVISGTQQAVELATAALKSAGIKAKKLAVSHAFHSPLMQPMLTEFEQVAGTVHYTPPVPKIVSNVTGELEVEAIAEAGYWCRHILQPVRFSDSLNTLYQKGYRHFVEIGPKPTLIGMGRYCLSDEAIAWLPSLHPQQSDWQSMLESLATLYVQGASINWQAFDHAYERHSLALPTYPFQRQRYWAGLTENHPQKVIKPLPVTAPSHIIDLLQQGKTESLVQLLEQSDHLTESELKTLPKLLNLLVQQHQRCVNTDAIKDWFYQLDWQPQPHPVANATSNGTQPSGAWLVFADRTGIGMALAQTLQQNHHTCILVYSGETYDNPETGIYQIQPASRDDYERLLQAIAAHPLRGILHLWSLEAAATDALTVPALKQAQTLGVSSALMLVQAVLTSGIPALPLWLITRGAVAVTRSPLQIAQAPLWGFGKVLALEHPDLWGGLIDLAPDPDELIIQQQIAQLMAEITAPQGEDQLAFRDGQRYVARLIRQSAQQQQPLSLQPEATYLITGGLGALGLEIARWFVAQGARSLVLVSRRDASESVQASLNQLRQTGAQILVAQADVTNAVELENVLEQIRTKLLPLRGIVHAAGVPGYGVMHDMSLDSFTTVLSPKVAGTWILHQLSHGMTLDFFVTFSSIASVWGSKGQAHYAAANQFLDAIAHHRHNTGLPALSINWGPWTGGGMAVEEFQMWMSRMGVEVLPPEQATVALGVLLGSDLVQTTVANVNWSRFKAIYEARGPRSLFAQLEDQVLSTPPPQTKATSAIMQQLEAALASDRPALLIAYLQTEVARVLKLEQLPDPNQDLFGLGMDSLMAIELVGAIQSQLQVELPIANFMQASTITALTALLLKQVVMDDETPDLVVTRLDLDQEVRLDDDIDPADTETRNLKTPATATRILLTGASGFLGAFVLHELLEQTSADLYCLVRAADTVSGLQKIKRNLMTYALWQDRYASRIVAMAGDLAKPRFGLAQEQFDQLAHQIDVIYHNAAILNFVYPYSAMKPTNVLGTKEVLRLACQFKLKPLHYVSTDAVFDSSGYFGTEVTEVEPLVHTDGIDLGYTQTKWVAEKLVTVARDRGLPVAIYRPPLIAGDSRSGIWNTDDFTCRFLKGCIEMGSMPAMNCSIALVPVDYVSRAIVSLSQQSTSLGRAFHLNNPTYTSWNEVCDSINELGYAVQQLPYEQWEARLLEQAGSQETALSSLIPFFLRRWSNEELTFAGFGQRRVKLNCEATVQQLEGSGITCPRINTNLLNAYFDYFIRSDFLAAPKMRQMSRF